MSVRHAPISLLCLASSVRMLMACSGGDDGDTLPTTSLGGAASTYGGSSSRAQSNGGVTASSPATTLGTGASAAASSTRTFAGGTSGTLSERSDPAQAGGATATGGASSSSKVSSSSASGTTATGGAGSSSKASSSAKGGSDSSSGGAASSGSSASCTDEYPFNDGYNCVQQAGWGKCNETWMAGVCNLSCGRCGNASAVPKAAASECGEAGTPPSLTGDAGVAPTVECSGGPVTDACTVTTGLSYACKQRFALGINYAWRNFGADFGGMKAWSLSGPSLAAAQYNADLARMRANGASVVRWWMFPDLRGDGVQRDAEDNPTGISDTAVADIDRALELAQRNDLYLVFTLFSFDAFRPSRTESGASIPGLSAMVSDSTRRANLINNVVRPVAKAVAASPYATRLLGWDAINEPEWAIKATGSNAQDFTPNSELAAVSLADMKSLINETLAVLEEVTPRAQRSVGWAAAKWSWAFTDVTKVTFNQPHIYGWVNDYWPYTTAPKALGYGNDRPTVMGEFYLLPGPFEAATPTFAEIMESWYKNGYAGAWAWDFLSGCGPGTPTVAVDLRLIKTFASAKGCTVSF